MYTISKSSGNAVHCLPDVICNGLVEQNRLLADDGQSTPGMDEDDNNDKNDGDGTGKDYYFQRPGSIVGRLPDKGYVE